MDTADYYDARDQIDGSAWHRFEVYADRSGKLHAHPLTEAV